MPNIRVLAPAARELEEAAAWYEAEQSGLGAGLLDEFERVAELLSEDSPPLVPIPGRAGKIGAKRILLHRFPFSVVVLVEKDEVVILAVAHQSRRPGYWVERIGT
ncbi:MAG: type II toxin-antitoxin system RelE/ParE family toxin [Pseudomonadota bacterium]